MNRDTSVPLCVDEWESVGPDAGIFRERFGGFTDPSCLMIDKIRCEPALRLWCFPLIGDSLAMSADRMVFEYLRRHHWCRGTGLASSYYVIHPEDGMHPYRLRRIQQKTGGTVPKDSPARE